MMRDGGDLFVHESFDLVEEVGECAVHGCFGGGPEEVADTVQEHKVRHGEVSRENMCLSDRHNTISPTMKDQDRCASKTVCLWCTIKLFHGAIHLTGGDVGPSTLHRLIDELLESRRMRREPLTRVPVCHQLPRECTLVGEKGPDDGGWFEWTQNREVRTTEHERRHETRVASTETLSNQTTHWERQGKERHGRASEMSTTCVKV